MELLAYLDPGSGSMIAGAVAGGVAGIAVAARTVAYRIRSPFKRKGADDIEETESADPDPTSS